MNRTVIVGSRGQDGRILENRLRAQGCAVLGIGRDSVRTTDVPAPDRVDITDPAQVSALVTAWRPDRVHYLAAWHHSSQESTGDPPGLYARSHAVHVLGLLHFLEAIRLHTPSARLFYASSCLVFGDPGHGPQHEQTPIDPRCIYGLTKAAGMHVCRFYRHTHGVFASAGILYNHESAWRQERFVSRKIITAARRIAAGSAERLILGDLSAQVDWGFAPDFVDAMVRILALPKPDDFIVATGETHTVQEFVELVFGRLGLDWHAHVEENPSVLQRKKRTLLGDSSKLRGATGWHPSVTFPQMVDALLKDDGS